MTLIDFILNIAGLLLWLNWRAAKPAAAGRTRLPFRLTLHPAGLERPRFYHWAGLPALLAARAVFYWQVGQPVHWNPQLILGPTSLSFRSDLPGRMLLFSVLSFGVTLGVFYLWLLCLSWLNGKIPETDPIQRLVRLWLGRLERLPGAVKPLLPLVGAVLVWGALNPLLRRLNMVPPNPPGRVLAQGAVIGLAAYLTLKALAVAFLILFLLNSYVYMGDFALWNFVNATTRRLLRPLRWVPLRAGRIDFAPVLSILLVLLAAEFARRGLARLYQHLL